MPRALLAAAALALSAAPASAAGYFDVAKLPPPPVSGTEMVSNLSAFTTAFPNRFTLAPNEMAAASFLRDEAAQLGYKSEIVAFPLIGPEPGAITRAVIATRPGRTKPDENILLIAHYDVTPQTIDGAYDNGSGVTMLRALAKSFASVPTNRTITFAFYNGEEEGALSSAPHAEQFKAEGRKVRAVLGFDMVGLSYPVATPVAGTTCLCMWRGDGDDAFDELLRHVNFGLLGFPDAEGKVEVVGLNDRNSDEASWNNAGFPTLRWAGMRTASSYPAYHMPDDTLATIDQVAGGRTYFEQGMRNTLASAYLTALALDNEMPVAKATATPTGPGTVAFAAAGSVDPDGPLGTHTWSFGDGTRATGATVTHSYAKGGNYTARLDLSDNLWPAVTASVELPVTVPALVAPKAKAKKKSALSRCNSKARKLKKASKRKKALRRCAKKHRRKRG